MIAADKYLAPYEPLTWQLAGLLDKSPVCLFTGSAGGGKSRCAAEKIHAFMLKYPGATGLALRKAREFAGKSIVPMLLRVIGNDPRVNHIKSDHTFVYANGSAIYVGGMRDDGQRESIRSIGQEGALDFVWMEEANAFTFEDFQELRARMRGRAAPWRQILPTTNPDAPNHWINQKLIIGGLASVHYSGAADNPNNAPDYIETLNTLTGVQHERLVLGRWVQAEGVIYDTFSLERNVSTEADYNPDLPVWWGVDDGYAEGQGRGSAGYHPRVILMGQPTAQGGLNIFAEYVATQEVGETSIRNALDMGFREPETVAIDSSAAELSSRFFNAGIYTIKATHKVSEGIKNVRRLIVDGNDVRLLKIHPRCGELITEMQSYRYDSRSSLVVSGEPKPLKQDDHCCDALRYMAWQLRYE